MQVLKNEPWRGVLIKTFRRKLMKIKSLDQLPNQKVKMQIFQPIKQPKNHEID